MECSRSFYLEQLEFRESSTIHVTALFDPTSPVHRPTIKATIICNFSHSCSHTYKSLAKRNTNQSLASNHSKSQLIDLHTQSRSHETKTSTTFKDTATLTRLVQHLFPSYKTRRVRDSRRIVNDILIHCPQTETCKPFTRKGIPRRCETSSYQTPKRVCETPPPHSRRDIADSTHNFSKQNDCQRTEGRIVVQRKRTQRQ